MLQISLYSALFLLSLALLFSFYRLVKGPSMPDRILALDTLYLNSIVVLILAGLLLDSALFFETALLIAVMGFVSTVALSKYLLRGDIME
ncbi:K+/H+ antiporter subunit F [Thiomicrorhabdus sp. 6S2-11]|jgi:multicomponent K+:H+ antiporter subunit F|uniref:K+/H+ antiporter subunit F n=1 Tax=Thiomicrorhabdus marina TaxID=2818442 RepID=A0ABS3Q5C9_9GAMM|nr:K+/H+ antiporter subunit F [Thiomicrorhabdus marina]MBO1927363.1 K+/H+ antiporter subunit F [Thiomicrorhabdus marina]